MILEGSEREATDGEVADDVGRTQEVTGFKASRNFRSQCAGVQIPRFPLMAALVKFGLTLHCLMLTPAQEDSDSTLYI